MMPLAYPLWLRATHFFNFLFLSLLVHSGLEIPSQIPYHDGRTNSPAGRARPVPRNPSVARGLGHRFNEIGKTPSSKRVNDCGLSRTNRGHPTTVRRVQ
jgi:hypothetical protein